MNVPMKLSRILIAEHSDQQMIFLKEIDGDRSFPIIIGLNEALAIDRRLKGYQPPRPMTHDLMAGIIKALGGRISQIIINDIREHTFIATICIESDGRMLEIDSRPSDAIALGAAFDTPILVAEHVLEAVVRGPSTQNERVQMLRDRLVLLENQTQELKARLADEEFTSKHSAKMLDELRKHLKTMTDEYNAIKRVLDKLG